jgi:hypothetical protein
VVRGRKQKLWTPKSFTRFRNVGHRGLGRKDQRLLGLQDQSPGVSFDRSNFIRGLGRERFRAFQKVQPERVARGIVQEQGQVIEAHHLLKPTGQVVEQTLPIAVGDDRFGDR